MTNPYHDPKVMRVFDELGAPYEMTKCEKCGHVGYTHDCRARLKDQAAERLARLVLGVEWHDDGVTIPADAMVAEAKRVLGEKP